MDASWGTGKRRRSWSIRKSWHWPDIRSFSRRSAADLAAAAAITALLSWFFYRSLWAMVPLALLIRPIVRRIGQYRERRRREELTGQFGEMALGVITALKAGYSAENAFREAHAEMAFRFGEDSAICRELYRIGEGLRSRVPLEELLADLAQRSRVEEIAEFADVFAICKRSGGNLVEVLERTVRLIRDRIEVETEIGIMLSARRLEQRIMEAVPFLIVIYIGAASKGFFDVLYGNAAGAALMTGCLAAYLGAFALSEKITSIRV